MPLKITNTLSKRREEFHSIQDNKVGIYVCGFTVYDVCHIGHARTFIAFDAIIRYLRFRGYDVTYVRNYTDVEDKIIRRANEEGVSSLEISERYIKSAQEDMQALGMVTPTVEPKVTDHMNEIIAFVQTLVDKQFAYAVDGNVYFEVTRFSPYGKLSNRTPEELQAGARIEIDERKRNPLDFALWKASKPGEPAWESPWGPGRPGWHIECSAMATKYLGQYFDLHAGGNDLVFPHHENEVAQSEAALGGDWVHYWLHSGMLNINHEKMSKSLGNYLTIQDALKRYHPEVLRFFILSYHYRSHVDFSDTFVEEKEQGLEQFYHLLKGIESERAKAPVAGNDPLPLSSVEEEARAQLTRLRDEFLQAMDDDFNTAKAIGALFQAATLLKKYLTGHDQKSQKPSPGRAYLLEQARAFFHDVGQVLGIFQHPPAAFLQAVLEKKLQNVDLSLEQIEQFIQERAEARKGRDWARADALRHRLEEHRILVQDTPEGTTWTVRR